MEAKGSAADGKEARLPPQKQSVFIGYVARARAKTNEEERLAKTSSQNTTELQVMAIWFFFYNIREEKDEKKKKDTTRACAHAQTEQNSGHRACTYGDTV